MRPILALSALLLLAAAPQDDAKPKTHTVARGALTPVLKLDARFDPARAAEIRIRLDAFSGSLKVTRVAPPGASVRKGETILALDDAPVHRALAAAERSLELARATLEKTAADAEAGAKTDALALEQSRTALKNAETDLRIFDEITGKQMLQRADLNVQYGLDYLSDQKEELDQLLKMYKSEELTNATSEIVVRRARRALERAKRSLEMTREETRVTKEVRHPQRRKTLHYAEASARQELRALETAQALTRLKRDAALADAKAAVGEQSRKVERLRRDVAACTVAAAFDGRVFYGAYEDGAWPQAERIARTLRPGEPPSTGTVLMTLCSADTRARAELPEARYFEVSTGQQAEVVPAAQPERTLKGTVRGKGMITRSSGRPYAVRIDFAEAPADLFPGMKGKATIRGTQRADVVLVPCKALQGEGADRKATVFSKGKKEEREVRAGSTDGTMVEILSGLTPGERVVLQE